MLEEPWAVVQSLEEAPKTPKLPPTAPGFQQMPSPCALLYTVPVRIIDDCPWTPGPVAYSVEWMDT